MVWCNVTSANINTTICFDKLWGDQLPRDSGIRRTNIMFNLGRKHYNHHDIYSLITAGVNIFNVDLIKNDNVFLEWICAIISRTEDMPFMYKFPYYRPVAVAVTINADSDILVELDKVDMIIVKKCTTREEVIRIRKLVTALGKKIPVIIAWTNGTDNIDTLEDILEGSDGVLYNCACSCEVFNTLENYVLDICEKKHKPIFNLYPTIIKDYYEKPWTRRPALAGPSRSVVGMVDGVAVTDDVVVHGAPCDAVQFLDKTCRAVESGLDYESLYYKLSNSCLFQLKAPSLPPLGVAMSAALGALRGAADAVFVLTCSGQSARWAARARPPCALVAVTARRKTARQMHLYRGVLPLYYDKPRAENWNQEYWNRVKYGSDFAMKIGLIKVGAKIVVLAPHAEGVGYCNSVQFLSIPIIHPELNQTI